MTILTAKSCEKKTDESIPIPECVASDNKTNLEKEGVTAGGNGLVLTGAFISNAVNNNRGKRLVKICVASALAVILVCGIVLGVVIYNTGLDKIFRGWCDVHFYEYKKEALSQNNADNAPHHGSNGGRRYYQHRLDGSFRQEVVIDLDYGIFERIEVPGIGESRRATVIHDFAKNLTAIADKSHRSCFVLPLFRSHVRPPRDFYNMLNNLKMGYYFSLPDAEIIREAYRAINPPVHHLVPFGYNIWKECHNCQTFLLTKENDPDDDDDDDDDDRSKRSACEVAGNQYCLGDGGTDHILCIKIKDCL